MAFEAPKRFLVGLPLGPLLRQVGAGRRMHAGLGEDHLMKRGIELAVAEPREPVATVAPRGDLDWGARRRSSNAAGDTTLPVSLPGDEIMRSQPAALRTLGRRLDVIAAAPWRHGTTRFNVTQICVTLGV